MASDNLNILMGLVTGSTSLGYGACNRFILKIFNYNLVFLCRHDYWLVSTCVTSSSIDRDQMWILSEQVSLKSYLELRVEIVCIIRSYLLAYLLWRCFLIDSTASWLILPIVLGDCSIYRSDSPVLFLSS